MSRLLHIAVREYLAYVRTARRMKASCRVGSFSSKRLISQPWAKAAEQAVDAGPLDPDLPVAVITAGHGDGGPWREVYADPATRARHGYATDIASASHANLLGFRHAAEIVKAIDFVLSAPQDRRSGSAETRAGG